MLEKENNEWKNEIRKYGIIVLICLGVMVVMFIVIAIMDQMEYIRWNLYCDVRYIGYTIGIPLFAIYPLQYLILTFNNRKKNYGEKKKPIPVVKLLFLFFMMYLTLPIFTGFIIV